MEISKILEYYAVVCKDVVNALKLGFACFLVLHTALTDSPFIIKTTKIRIYHQFNLNSKIISDAFDF